MIDALNLTDKVQPKVDFLRKYFKDLDIFVPIDSDIQLVIIDIGNPYIQEIIDQPEFEYELKKAGFVSWSIRYGWSEIPNMENIRDETPNKIRNWNDTLTLKTYIDGE